MSVISIYLRQMEFHRTRTLTTLDDIAKQPDPVAILGWRPGPGRAHIAWQLMHIGVTEELFATERLIEGTQVAYPDLVPRFKGGSVPDDILPEIGQIRNVLDEARGHLMATLEKFTDADLPTIYPWFKERGWTFERVLQVICWHEAHHQGQAHLTYNLWKSANSQ